jgi:hypothetical protein
MKSAKIAILTLGASVVLTVFSRAAFQYDGHGKRDPFWSLVSGGGAIRYYEKTETSISDLQLEGVMVGGENLAVINGKVLKVNDKIGEFSIKAIRQDRVILERGGSDFELKLKKGE